jgi:hypothetical protein
VVVAAAVVVVVVVEVVLVVVVVAAPLARADVTPTHAARTPRSATQTPLRIATV